MISSTMQSMLDQPVPDFALPATGNQTFSLSQARGTVLLPAFADVAHQRQQAARAQRNLIGASGGGVATDDGLQVIVPGGAFAGGR